MYIVMHATHTARDFFLPPFHLSGLFTFIFFKKPVLVFLLLLAVAIAGSCLGRQNVSLYSLLQRSDTGQVPMFECPWK